MALRTSASDSGAMWLRLPWPLTAARLYAWQYDLRSGEVSHSDNVAEVLGFAPPSDGPGALALTHPDDRAAVDACMARALRGEERFAIEYRIIHPLSGATVWVRAHGCTVEEDGIPVRLFGIAQNVTREKEEQAQLRRSEERSRLALEAAGVGAWECDLETRTVYWSPEYRELYGIAPDAQPGFDAGIDCVLPEDRAAVLAELRRAAQEGDRFFTEHRIAHPEKGARIIRGRGRTIAADATGHRRMAGIVMDVTDLHAAEVAEVVKARQLELAMEAGQLGIWDWDIRRDHVAWTPRVYMLHGVQPGQFGGRAADFAQMVHPDDRQAVERSIGATLRDDAPYAIEFRVARPDGTIGWLATRATVIRAADGTPLRMVGVTYDVTARMELLRQTERARAAAEEASRLKDQFLAMLGHELRNPLAPIVSALHVMRMRDGGAHAQERAIIERQVTHLSRLVDDLLDLSRISRGKITLDPKPIDFRSCVQMALEMTQPLFAERSAPVKLEMPDEAVHVMGDMTRLSQLVANLLANAAKFTPLDGDIFVALECEPERARLLVRDSGNGIDAALLPRVFEMFIQGEQSLARPNGGLGLGLALVKGIAELHGGDVAVDSGGAGRGSVFTVRLPRHQPSPLKADAGPSAPPTRPVPRRILVVDDNVDAAESLVQLLRLAGHEADAAHDAASGMATFDRVSPDIAILDIGLPDMDGYRLAQELRAQGRAYLIALTGYGLESDRARASAAGFDQHLIKPVTPEALFRAVAEAALSDEAPAAADPAETTRAN